MSLAARVAEAGVFTADPAQVRAVEQVDDARFSGQRRPGRRRGRQGRSTCRGPGRCCWASSTERSTAPASRTARARARRRCRRRDGSTRYTEPFPVVTQMLPVASTTGAAPPIHTAPWSWPAAASTVKISGVPPASGTAITRPRYGGAVAVVAPHPEDDTAGIERQPGALQQGRRAMRRQGRRPGSAPSCPCRCRDRSALWADAPFTNSSATANSSDRAGSITGVPVMPDRGRDVPAGKVTAWHRGADVGRPEDGTRARRQRVHGVVLGGDEDAIAEHQGFGVQRSVERWGGPRPRRQVDARHRRRHAGPAAVPW